MLALIGADKTVRARGGVRIRQTRVCGMRVTEVILKAGPDTGRRRLEKLCMRAALELKLSGIDTVCFGNDFPGRDFFKDCGFKEQTVRPVLERGAAAVARMAARDECDTVAVFSRRIMRAETETIKRLALDFRYVLLFTGTCPAALVRDLGERMGAALIEAPSEKLLKKAGAAVFFDAPVYPVALPDGCAALTMSCGVPENVSCGKYVSGVSLGVGNDMETLLPEGYPRDALLAAMVASGAAGAESVYIEKIQMADTNCDENDRKKREKLT